MPHLNMQRDCYLTGFVGSRACNGVLSESGMNCHWPYYSPIIINRALITFEGPNIPHKILGADRGLLVMFGYDIAPLHLANSIHVSYAAYYNPLPKSTSAKIGMLKKQQHYVHLC